MAPRPNPRIAAAFKAMKNLEIEEAKVKPVLKKLLKLYDKNWELIEEDNYRTLLDAIFEEGDDFEEPEQQKKNKRVNEEEMEAKEAEVNAGAARPLKRLRLRGENNSPSSASSPLNATALEGCSAQQPQNKAVPSDGNERIAAHPGPMRDYSSGRGKQPASPQVSLGGIRHISERASPSKLPNNHTPPACTLTIPKSEPGDEADYEVSPLAVIRPEPSSSRHSSMKNGFTRKQQGVHVPMTSSHHSTNKEVASDVVIASSAQGEVKLSLSCSSALQGPDFRMPTQEQLLKMMEDKCLRSYKITDPNFSVAKMLRDICDCMFEFSTDSNDDSQEGLTRSNIDVLKESEVNGTPGIGGSKDLDTGSHSSNGSIQVNSFSALVSPRGPFSPSHLSSLDDAALVSKMDRTNDIPQSDVRMQPEDPMSPNSLSLVVVPHHQFTADDIRSFHDVNDITKGEESNQISWVNEITNDFPPPFNYIPQNLVFQDAYVNISLSRIGAEDSCSCIGSCILLSTHCGCTVKTGGEFAYTAQGLMKEDFLEECIAISHNPQQHCFYCKDCPLERSKSDGCLEPCKGHLKRKFIKECWIKCGCGKQCGNRIVQRGISHNLQVFFTSEGKGWGLRTLEDLPKGAFVCEFVGEILTIEELHERNMKCTDNEKSTYPILLDADWDSGFVKDEKALCLDAASFGNIARFINHRCSDANLVEIPIQIECPDRHYYHFALFTTRKIAAGEELTWDYGIDFDDHDQPVKLFQCKCGSKFCRNMKRSNRSTRSASIAG